MTQAIIKYPLSAIDDLMQPTYPNERDCEHGGLRDKCEVCELMAELAEAHKATERARAFKRRMKADNARLRTENARLRATLESIADMGGEIEREQAREALEQVQHPAKPPGKTPAPPR